MLSQTDRASAAVARWQSRCDKFKPACHSLPLWCTDTSDPSWKCTRDGRSWLLALHA